MSLFDSLPSSALPPGVHVSSGAASQAPQVPQAPPVVTPVSRADVEAEKQKLLAQDKARVEGTQTTKLGCGAPGCGVGHGVAPGYILVGNLADGQFETCKSCKGKGGISIQLPADATPVVGQVVTPPPPPAPTPAPSAPSLQPSSPMAVTPPDAPPPPSLLKAADPVPPGEVAQIVDPALRQTVTEHAQQHAAMTAAQEAEVEKQKQSAGTSVWCKWSEQQVKITMAQALTKKYTCECTKVYSTKEAVAQPDGSAILTLKRHKPKNKPEPELVAAPPPPPPPSAGAPTEDDEDETEDDEVVPSLPPAPPPPPPPPLPPVAASAPVGEMTQMVNQMFAPPAPNGHSNGNGQYVAPAAPVPTVPWETRTLQTLQSIDVTLKEMLAHMKGIK